MTGRMHQYDVDGRTVDAYLALPAAGDGPGVLLLHAWWGLNDFFRATADRLAREGFLVLAPDYYAGEVASTVEQAKQLRNGLDRKGTGKLVGRALDHLLAHPNLSSSTVGVIGFSLGCGFALGLARSSPAVSAVILFYGTGGGKYAGVQADFLGHFAENDKWGADAKKVAALRERLAASGREVTFHTYPGTGHWFFEQDRESAYDKEAAEEAWARTLEFLRSRVA